MGDYNKKTKILVFLIGIDILFCLINCYLISFLEPSTLVGIYALSILGCGFMIFPLSILVIEYVTKKPKHLNSRMYYNN